MSVDRLSRRRALTVAGLASVGSVAVVGCLGGNSRLVTLGVGRADSRSYQAGHALAVAADRHSDRLRVRTESVGPPTERLYALDAGSVDAAGLDNTTLYRASESRGAFDLDPVESLPHQGFAYGRHEHYWLAVDGRDSDHDGEQTRTQSTAESLADDSVLYPGQPSTPSRLVTEQLCRDAGLWDDIQVDNRPRQRVADGIAADEIGLVVGRQDTGQLADWCRTLDRQVGEQLAVVPPGESLEAAIDDAPNTASRQIEPQGWENAEAGAVDGWEVLSQWLWSPDVKADSVAKLTRIAYEEHDTLTAVDPSTVDRTALTAGRLDELPLHDGAAAAFEEYLDSTEAD